MSFEPEYKNTFQSIAEITPDKSQIATTTILKSVITPKEYLKEEFVEIKKTSLDEIESIVDNIRDEKWPIGELLLGCSTLCLGGIISAVCSQVPFNSLLGIIIYLFGTALAVGTLVSYIFVRNNQLKSIHELGIQIKKLLPEREDHN